MQVPPLDSADDGAQPTLTFTHGDGSARIAEEQLGAPRTNWLVFGVSGAIIFAITLWAALAPAHAEEVIGSVVNWMSRHLGWVYIVTLTVTLGFVTFIAISKYGKVRLGPDHARPKYNLVTWTAMLFAAGIGVDLMFYGVAGPVAQYLSPPEGGGETVEAARQAVVWTSFHYGINGWSLYALIGAALGYFAYRYRLPLSIRAALFPIIGKRVKGRTGDAIDIAAVIATVFGLAASLGIGVIQLNFGLNYLFGWPEHISIQIALALLGVGMAILSCVSGVDRGIRRLSELNFFLAIAIMLWVLIAGKTTMLIDAIVMNIGDFISRFPAMTLDTMALDRPDDWMNAWTVFFWAWWIAWSPFVGMFLARISRGRTIREFVIGVLVVPFTFTLIWISIFGNSAIDSVRSGNAEFGETAMNIPEHGFYMLLDQYPGALFLAGLATFTGLLFYVTSADSGSLMMSSFTSRATHPNQDGPKWSRVFWAAMVGALTLAMLFVGGFATIQYMTIIMALPFTIVIYLIMAALWKSLRRERMLIATSPRSGAGEWNERIARIAHRVGPAVAEAYLDQVAVPALEKIATEMARTGAQASLSSEPVDGVGVHQLDLTVVFEDQLPFRYQIFPVAQRPFGAGKRELHEEESIRLEVFSATGSRGYDVMGMTEADLIDDIVDRYEQHLHTQGSHSVTEGFMDQLEAPGNWAEDFSLRRKRRRKKP